MTQIGQAKFGAFGGNGGMDFDIDLLILDQNDLTQFDPNFHIFGVELKWGQKIDHIRAIYSDAQGGNKKYGTIHGGSGGDDTFTFILDAEPNERLIGIQGKSGDSVDSIQLITTNRMSPVFGGGGGHPYLYRGQTVIKDTVAVGALFIIDEIIGFWGRSDHRLDAIGVYTRRSEVQIQTSIT